MGSLPPAVYWRRRAAVAAAVTIAVLLSMAMCRNGQSQHGAAGPTAEATVDTSPSTEASEVPVEPGGTPTAVGASGEDGGGPLVGASSPSAGGGGVTGTPAGACADADMQITTVPDPAAPLVGAKTTITIKIRNISTRACTRDVGSAPQELRIMSGSVLIWSSDHCQPSPGGSDVRTFGPGVEATFYVTWDGHATKAGCVRSKDPVPAGPYQIVARLGTRYSDPKAFAVVPPGS